MIKKILNNLNTSNEEKDENFSHSENILSLIEGIIIHENSYWKYVNILNELTTLCYEDPVNFRKFFFVKNENVEEQKKKANQIFDRILIILEKYEDARSTFLCAIAKLIFINAFDLNVEILRTFCDLAYNEEYKYDVLSVFEEIVAAAMLNSAEKETLKNIFRGLQHMPRDKAVARSFTSCIHKVIKLLRDSFDEHILTFLSVATLDRHNCLIAYDEGLLKILTTEMTKREEDSFEEAPPHLEMVYRIVQQLCGNHVKLCAILVKEKMHLNFYFKKIKEIIKKDFMSHFEKKKSIFCNIILHTINNICAFEKEILFELCNSHHFIDLLLIGIKMEMSNPYFLSASLAGLLLVLKNEELYKKNIEYILENTKDLKIVLPFLFGQKYNSMLRYYHKTDEQVEIYLHDIVKNTLDIFAFFFMKDVDKFTMKVKRGFRDSDINYYLLVCLESKNEEVVIRLLRCIHLIPFDDCKSIEFHKIFFLLREKEITLNEKWKEIYYYCVKIYMKVIKNEEISKIVKQYKFEDTLTGILRIMNQFLLRAVILHRKNDFVILKGRKGIPGRLGEYVGGDVGYADSEAYAAVDADYGEVDLNKITVEFLRTCSRYPPLRHFMRNNSVSYYFINILTNEDSLFSEINVDYDILIERTWCSNIENVFKALVKNNISKDKKICLRLLINIADMFSGYFYQFKTDTHCNIFDLCTLEEKHWNRKKVLQYFYMMNSTDLEDYKKQLHTFINSYMTNLYTLLNLFVEKNIFSELKKEQRENYFPGVLKFNKLKYEKKISKLKLKEKHIRSKILPEQMERRDNKSGTHLFDELQSIKNKKKKLFLWLHNNNFQQTFDITLVDDDIECNLEHMFEMPKVVKKKKNIRPGRGNVYLGKNHPDVTILKRESPDGFLEDSLGGNIKGVNNGESQMEGKIERTGNLSPQGVQFDDNKEIRGRSSSTSEPSYGDDESSASSLAKENPNETVLDKIACELLSFDKEKIYDQKTSQLNILLFSKRGLFVNCNKGQINVAHIFHTFLRIFFNIIINSVNSNEHYHYLRVKEFFLKTCVLKTMINLLSQCTFYDCSVYAHFFRLYSEILKQNLTAMESMDMLIFYNIFFYYCKLLSREFINKLINEEYALSEKEQYFYAEICHLFYCFTQKIIYIQFSHYSEIQKWCVDCSLFFFFYKNNILLMLYLFIYINSVHHGSVYSSYIYHKKQFTSIHTIFFYTLFTLSYLMCFSKKLKYFILYFINYKRYIHKVLFRRSVLHSLFLYQKLIYVRIVLQNQLSQERRAPAQIYHISPVIYVRENAVEWYFLAIGLDEYYLIYIPDNFEENIMEDKDIKLVIHSAKKYTDITRICLSKHSENFFVFGYINHEDDKSYELYDIFISVNRHFRDEIISYSQFLSGGSLETKVDLVQDTVFANNLKRHMNIRNIIITSFAYKEVKPSEYSKKKAKTRDKRKHNLGSGEHFHGLSDEGLNEESLQSEPNSDTRYSNSSGTVNHHEEAPSSGTESNDEEFNIFRRNTNSTRKRKLFFFVLTKNHLYIFKLNFKKWLCLSPFIDGEKDDIHLYVESSLDSAEEPIRGKKIFKNEKIYLNNFLGLCASRTDDQNVAFARKCAVRNTIKHVYSSNNTEYTNEHVVLSTNTTSTAQSDDQRDGNQDDHRGDGRLMGAEHYLHNQRYLSANKSFLKIVHKYNNENLNKIKFVNNYESIVALSYKVKNGEFPEKKIKIIMFDDYTRELWKRSLAFSLNIQMTSSEWLRKWT
ncbi:conserved Plasmodium protein, unknown function [Plasmodium knowlesi strain H]|uniref:Uncharacterized protein n=3 Tax=Plasmodium knowlesi TaxID=5850 RepID=A0A5K1TUT5_PLAKH|nr:conserved Plasmodium protein, unknown function [Plasmodium knowlesi strain H]OTN65048.1 Uncharacterized protein PKNOH_S120157400 [Plasmodium knowlesi]CAA9988430.1 conserved Plasmodium protein, unknown function [Plasmodium knowlesi strain H]SBO19883.1 conserved Plasmodium protein, unknown function [Plasmodium knowlesi strain H]SBO20413.1 conserved Plasmodium protein, unknown function [Plasmodium knowlesi strain H]VVS77904.1 conserved Plasmodium protein, unknown function [Plasmodium knowlesi |eukprot:XP_002259411.1 hypothetical protein, conserved in Plasmodium species [Plasmodium knowlesi strain H]